MRRVITSVMAGCVLLATASGIGSAQTLEPAAVDPSSRASVAASFQDEVMAPMNAHGANVGWTGDLASCQAGTISSGFSSMSLSHINWLRQMVGSPPVAFDPDRSAHAQDSALITAANQSLSHFPPSDWDCWSASGQEGASKSNISIDFNWSFGVFIGDQVFDYVMDAGSNNTAVGHRNWILNPNDRPFGWGAVVADQVAATAMWVVPDSLATSTDEFVMWPAKGYVPMQVVFPRWNLAYDGDADFTGASVSMKWGNVTIPFKVISRGSSGGLNQIVWEISEESPFPDRAPVDCEFVSFLCSAMIDASGGDIPVDITVSGIEIDGQTMSYSYRVTIFDPGSTGGGGGSGDSGTFSDVDGSVFEADIEWLAESGITKGCNPPSNTLFCPEDAVTRGQMAAFMVRALELTESGTVDFDDDNDSIFESDIEKMAHAGITMGCNPPTNTRFCPDSPVTRQQMAAFLVRALDLTTPGTADFTDDNDSIFEADIEKLAEAGITKGCNPPSNTRFCPGDPVTRGQMAAFLKRALG